MRVKSEYIHHKEIKGALGVKLIGNGFEKVMAGTPVMVVGPDDEEEDIKAEVMQGENGRGAKGGRMERSDSSLSPTTITNNPYRALFAHCRPKVPHRLPERGQEGGYGPGLDPRRP